MRPASKNHHRRHAQIQVTYTISELAELAGRSDDWVRGELRRSGIIPQGPGRRGVRVVIYLSDLMNKLPALFSSIQKSEVYGSS